MKSVKEVIELKKLKELKTLMNFFELEIIENRKNSLIESVSSYLKNNIRSILLDFATYDQINIMSRVCSEDYILYENSDLQNKSIITLEYLGLIYIENENEMTRIYIPYDLKNEIQNHINGETLIKYCIKRQELLDMFSDILELYGVLDLDIIVKYIKDYAGEGYRIHQCIKIIHKYNMIHLSYYIYESTYYNMKIEKNELPRRLNQTLKLRYKYYEKYDIKNIINRKTKYEKEIYFILNRYYKNIIQTNEHIKNIKDMIRIGLSDEEIVNIIMSEIKGLSNLGKNKIQFYLGKMRKEYPLWGLKGYLLEELREYGHFINVFEENQR